MTDTCRFFEHKNIANFFRSNRFTFVVFTRQKQVFLRKRLHMLRKEKLQIVKEKMKQRSFFASALLIVLLSCILRITMVKKIFNITSIVMFLTFAGQSFNVYVPSDLKRLPSREPRKEPPDRRLPKNKQGEKVVFLQKSNLQPLEYWSTLDYRLWIIASQ